MTEARLNHLESVAQDVRNQAYLDAHAALPELVVEVRSLRAQLAEKNAEIERIGECLREANEQTGKAEASLAADLAEIARLKTELQSVQVELAQAQARVTAVAEVQR